MAVGDNTIRANICCRASIEEGYVLRHGAEVKTYQDPHEACEDDARFRDTYRLIKAATSAVIHGFFRPRERHDLTPSCRVIAGTFAYGDGEAELAIFIEVGRGARQMIERTLAVQVTQQDPAGQFKEFYTKQPRHCRQFDQGLASASLCFDTGITIA
ncbi:MAG: hypothetical protein HY543_07210 [Deltaproteobacteria bacterium]|nr:hypothetical protein [Deltaproteobacteria bacterium]